MMSTHRVLSPTRQGKNFWLRIVRSLVILFALFLLASAVLGIFLFPKYASQHAHNFTVNEAWTPEQTQAALAELGWPATTVAWFEVAIDITGLLIFNTLALLLLTRKSDDWFVLYVAFTFVVYGQTTGSITAPVVDIFPFFKGLHDWIGAWGWQLYFIMFYAFPDGHFVPRWARWLVLAWICLSLFSTFGPATGSWLMYVFILLVLSTLASQIYRYFRYSGPLQKQQTKVVLFTLVIGVVVAVLVIPLSFQSPGDTDLGIALARTLRFRLIVNLLFLFIPVAIGIAILRYRLWDLDIIIRRTLVYGVLTVILALFYFGSVILLQQIFRGLSGQDSQIAIVISTLAIAALFSPLRRRVQEGIDRRFYRKKYDAAQALEAFSAKMRNEVELDELTAHLLAIVDETMQPANVSLWLVREHRLEGSQAR